MKLFHKQFGKVESQYELLNGFRLTGGFEYAQREAVVNATDYSFKDETKVHYTSNNPQNPLSDEPAFETHEAFRINITARVRIKQKYIERPDVNIILGSKYPTVVLNYFKGIKDFVGSDVDFDLLEVGVEDRIKLGMLGEFNYSAWYGNFINNSGMYFIDHAHFMGNKTIFSGFASKRFDLLDYYEYSTSKEYIQAFAEHEFGGLILNKIPLVRKLMLNEIAGFRYLHVPGHSDHFEFSIGLEKLGFIRADYVMALDDAGNFRSGFMIGLKGIIN